MWKNEKFTFTEKYFVKSTSLAKTVLSRNFCENSESKFRRFTHFVLAIDFTKNSELIVLKALLILRKIHVHIFFSIFQGEPVKGTFFFRQGLDFVLVGGYQKLTETAAI